MWAVVCVRDKPIQRLVGIKGDEEKRERYGRGFGGCYGS